MGRIQAGGGGGYKGEKKVTSVGGGGIFMGEGDSLPVDVPALNREVSLSAIL